MDYVILTISATTFENNLRMYSDHLHESWYRIARIKRRSYPYTKMSFQSLENTMQTIKSSARVC